MATIERFEELDAWRSARQLTSRVYGITSGGGFSRDFGLRDQIRRAAVSVMANIAEGFESRTTPLFIELLGRARGSAGEVRAQLYVALDVGYLRVEQYEELSKLASKTSSCITGLIRYLERKKHAFHVRTPTPQADAERSTRS